MTVRYVLLDFDGTLTAPEHVTDVFLSRFRTGFLAAVGEAHAETWDRTLAAVRLGSPHLAWMLEGYEACPADADPYTLASAVASRVLASFEHPKVAPGETDVLRELPYHLYKQLYDAPSAPFRPEVEEALTALHATGATLAVISNSAGDKIDRRLDALALERKVRDAIQVYGGARKFGVRPATEHGPARAAFDALPDFVGNVGLARPVWLRRGAFFDAMARVWGADPAGPASTIFCGDIWELDLALPSALGCAVHLVERAAPLATHKAERVAAATTAGAGFSPNLWGLVERVRGH
ncbi:MAG: hypothetical protein Q8P41_25785 [Pseudomonadota bacterium]|nr:hypothetical protein [Pseudomonadota bacterium]